MTPHSDRRVKLDLRNKNKIVLCEPGVPRTWSLGRKISACCLIYEGK